MEGFRNLTIRKVLKILAFALAIGAFVMVCTGIGQTKASSFGPERIDNPTVASHNEAGAVVADSDGSRLLFTDASGSLVGLYGLDNKQTPVDKACEIHQHGDIAYVAGLKHAEDGENIRTEAILKFNMRGDYLGAVWRQDYKENEVHVTPSVCDITTDDEGNVILVAYAEQKMHTLQLDATVTRLGKDSDKGQVLHEESHPCDSFPYDVRYDVTRNRLAMIDFNGTLYVEHDNPAELVRASVGDRQLMVQDFDTSGDMAVMYDEKSEALLRADNLFDDITITELATNIRCSNVEIGGDTATAVLDTGVLRIFDLVTGSSYDIKEIPLTPAFAARTSVMLVCTIYLVVFVLVLLVRWLVRTIHAREQAKIRRGIVATAVALICMVAMVFHMFDLLQNTITSRQEIMSQMVLQTCVTSPSDLGNAATNESRRAQGEQVGDDDGTDMTSIVMNVEGILASSFANNNGVQCTLYTTTDSGPVRYLFSNQRDSVVMGQARGEEISSAVHKVIDKVNEREGPGDQKAYHFVHDGSIERVSRRDKSGHDVVSCVAPLIASDGTCCTAIEVSCHADTLLRSIMDNMLVILLMFSMVTASIYVISDEIIRSGQAFLRYRELHGQGVEWAETLLGRPLNFVLNIAFGMDAAFAVVIAKDMLAGSGLDSTTFVWGIPALAITLGTTLGTLAHALLSSRVSGRSFAVPMLLVGVAAQGLSFCAVLNSWFVVFVVCKLLSSACFAGTTFISKNLAGGTAGKDVGNEHLSLVVNRSSVNIAGKGAAVVASVVGGALASAGNQWVYLAGALVSLLALPLLLLALPKGRVISKHGEEANIRNVFEFLRSPIMLATLAFAIFPTVLASGYKSYILPLFLDAAGVSKSDIASLFALGNVLLYAFTDALITHRNARGRWFLTWIALIGLGVLFVLFSYNQAPTWAVVAVVVITVLSWLAGDWKHNARFWAKKDYGFSFDQSQAALTVEESVVKNAQAPVLASLLSLGASVCCLVLGIFLGISGFIYFLATRKRGDFA